MAMTTLATGNRDDLVDLIYRCEPIRVKDYGLYEAACRWAACRWDPSGRPGMSKKDSMIEEMKAAIWLRNQFYRGHRKDWRSNG